MDITRSLIFVAVLFAMFAPKLGSLDTSPVASLACLVLLAHRRDVLVPREYLVAILLLLGLLAYSIVAALLNGSSDTYATMRLSRALLSTAALGLAFYNLDVRPGTVLNILIAVLLLNAGAVLLEILVPSSQSLLAGLYGFNKVTVRTLRAFGLTAGYDTAGYLCVIGALLSAFKIIKGGRVLPYLLTMTVFTVAALFTSRSSMTLNLLVMTSVCVTFLFRGGPGLKLVGMSYLAGGFLLVTSYMLPLLLSTFSVADLQIAASAAEGDIDYTRNFARTDLSEWRNTMWIVPGDFWGTLFGVGSDIPESDMGYVKMIFMSGVVGLSVTLAFYGYLLWRALALNRAFPDRRSGPDAGDAKVLTLMLIVFLAAIYVVNVKNLYFYTRAYHEMAIILFFMALNWNRRQAVPA